MKLAPLRRRAAFAAAWAALIWERAAAALWPALAFPTAFLIAALFGVWERTGDPWRAGCLAASVVLALGFGVFGALRKPWPRAKDARRRVEIDSELQGRPFEALDDSPVAADPGSRALWRAHQERMREALTHVRARRPRAAFAARDVAAIRGVLTLAALGGIVIAGAAAPGRVLDALAPSWLRGGATRLDIQAWIAPQEYTGRPPIFLRGDTGSFEAPQGSDLIVRVVGANRAPALRLQDARGKRHRLAFAEDGPQAHAATASLTADSVVSIAGRSWAIHVLPDTPPGAAFASDPKAGQGQELTFDYLFSDDYGVVQASLRIALVDQPDLEPMVIALDAPPGAKSIEETAHLDLTEHPWAGKQATLTLVAQDALGQVGESDPFTMKIPERIFVDPLARAVLEQRTRLFSDTEPYAPGPGPAQMTAEDAADKPPFETDQTPYRMGRAPDSVKLAHRSLQYMRRGADKFEDDPAVHLGLAYVIDRLQSARERSEISDLRDVLWDIALRAEGGDLADAERALKAAERELARALARGDSPEEIQRLMEKYREAVNRYMELLTLEAMRDGRVLSDFSGGQQGMSGMSQNQLQEMLKALQDLAETGSTEEARRALQALSELLANMQVQIQMGGGGGSGGQQQDSPMSQAMRDALQELAEVLGLQRETMDQTQAQQGREGQQGQQGQQGQPGQGQQGQGQQGQGQQGQGQQGQQGQVGRGQQGGETNGQQGAQGLGGQPGQPGQPGQGQVGRQAGRGQPGQPGGSAPGGVGDPESGPGWNQLLDQQREIRRALNELMQGMQEGQLGAQGGANNGQAPAGEALDRAEEGLRQAERAMGEAEGALEDQDAQGALRSQGEALESLREGMQALSEGAQQQERADKGMGQEQPSDRANRDPFGRSTSSGSGFDVGNSVKVPDEMERRKARDILDELRKRSGEADRPADELDYLRRLLERFR